MTATDGSTSREAWETELFADHRWGLQPDCAAAQHARLRSLWQAAQHLDAPCREIMSQIIVLEICNWTLEDSIVALCAAIGKGAPSDMRIGHGNWHANERMRKVWAYYLACRHWLAGSSPSAYEAVLHGCDADRTVENRVAALLGQATDLKTHYVERFCLCLEYWLGDCRGRASARTLAHAAAVKAVEEAIKKRDPQGQIVNAFAHEGDGKIPLCHHKLFRRYDIILSSIGAGQWRAAMPMRGRDGLERAELLESFLAPIEAWLAGDQRGAHPGSGPEESIRASLGERDKAKLFLASLLISLLRSQGLAARQRAERRAQAGR